MSSLTLITLPIGNIEDLTPRAKQALESHQILFAEDTRVTRDLLKRVNIDYSCKRISSFHDHTEGKKLQEIISILDGGEPIAIVSDAGSPVISDPAYPLIRACIDAGHILETAPGVSSVLVALELSGLPPHPFSFHGFSAREELKKRKFFEACSQTKGTHIFFEAPTRILKTLKVLGSELPDAEVAVARELTKTFESVYRFKASEYSSQEITCKGEFVVLFHIGSGGPAGGQSRKAVEMIEKYISEGGGVKDLSKIFSEITGERSKEIYQKLLSK